MSRPSPFRPFPPVLLALAVAAAPVALHAEWIPSPETERVESPSHPGLHYAKRSLRLRSGEKTATLHLALFNSRDFRLRVIDLGDGSPPAYDSAAEAFRATGCPAGVNGGFFHPGYRPIGLVIAGGRRLNRFESAKLLSGVVYSDPEGIHIVRRSAFQDHPGITALLQTGPYLIEHGSPVHGLSTENPRRRTFIATDWRRNWAVGVSSALTLRELSAVLDASPSIFGWPVDRAINLDGGSSSAFFFDLPAPGADVTVPNWKRIRNVLGIAPKP